MPAPLEDGSLAEGPTSTGFLRGPPNPAGASLGSGDSTWGPPAWFRVAAAGRASGPKLGWMWGPKNPLLLSLATICRGAGVS